jgi:hypothetical protein
MVYVNNIYKDEFIGGSFGSAGVTYMYHTIQLRVITVPGAVFPLECIVGQSILD